MESLSVEGPLGSPKPSQIGLSPQWVLETMWQHQTPVAKGQPGHMAQPNTVYNVVRAIMEGSLMKAYVVGDPLC